MSELTYQFDELPLYTDLGFDGLLINGEATIRYFDDGEWFITAIHTDGYRTKTQEQRASDIAAGRGTSFSYQRLIEIESGSTLHAIIYDALMNRHADHISDAVFDEMENNGGALIGRSAFAEHNTLNHRQQGIV